MNPCQNSHKGDVANGGTLNLPQLHQQFETPSRHWQQRWLHQPFGAAFTENVRPFQEVKKEVAEKKLPVSLEDRNFLNYI